MKNINIKYWMFLFLTMFIFSACQDIEDYNIGWNSDNTSTAAPEITNITDVRNNDSIITSGALTQLISINGTNLSGIKSIYFNDVEVDLKMAYVKINKIIVPVPRNLPTEITNKISVTTELGKTTFDFEVKIPELVITGLYNKYTIPGDTAEIDGNFFDLYQLTPDDGVIYFGDQELPIISATDKTLFFKVPTNATNDQIIKLGSAYSKLKTPVAIPGKYRETGFKFIDFENPSSYNGMWAGSEYITDGKKQGDPKPLNGKFLRINREIGAWAWTTYFAGGVSVSSQDMVDNKDKYKLEFEINTNSQYPIKAGNFVYQVFDGWYVWNPADAGVAYNTYGNWKTISIDLSTLGAKPGIGWKGFGLTCQPTETMYLDVSFANFRIVEK